MHGTSQHEPHPVGSDYVKDAIFGFNDGLLVAFGVIAGVAPVSATSAPVILAGLAGGLANAVSMTVGDYLSTKTQIQVWERIIQQEEKEMCDLPDIEEQEIRDIYKEKGFKGKKLESIVKHIVSDRELWLNEMLIGEFGIVPEKFPNPLKAAAIMSVGTVIGALIPVAPFFFMVPATGLQLSIALSALSLFAVGAIKSHYVGLDKFKGGLEMLLLGFLVALVTYTISSMLGISL